MSFFSIVEVIRALAQDKKGVTAVEYGIVATLIILACITAITLVGTNLSNKFNAIAGAL